MRSSQVEETLFLEWAYRDQWSASEAVQIAMGLSPSEKPSKRAQKFIESAQRAGWLFASPQSWFWWGERNHLPFSTEWWVAASPKGPIGYDGRHFAYLRGEMLSNQYYKRERELIGEWARKPYWTKREAIDLLLNFAPYSTEGWRGAAPETGATIREREDRFRILDRALELGEIEEKSRPKSYLEWFSDKGYYVSDVWRRAFDLPLAVPMEECAAHTKLIAELEEVRGQLQQRDVRISELEGQVEAAVGAGKSPRNSAITQRINTLQKMFISAAVDGLGYNPVSEKSDVPQQIAAKSEELGCPVTRQTIQTHLREACDEHVDGQYWRN